ncbi:Polyphosphate glucokinase [Candidatus Burkholderia verschuerenii]|uniref:Polyphosphate glucokinase n=1 Tax=Candidatus Burkholderia verschuerenii TaxID=242163 RepID=A0A0L0MH49_9BURK|nr:ROK family protein [Candidatus Burkholderia verschuerenii]KND62022.1 Polyphosphate glucokinase [Candidatus Burkholderia verschuerenii]
MHTDSKTKQKTHVTAESKDAVKADRILAIDVGGTGLKAAVISGTGEMLTERARVDTPHPTKPDIVIKTLIELVKPLVAQQQPSHISIGFPGVVRDNVVLTAPNLGNQFWKGVPLAQTISESIGNVPARMINDAEMQGLAAIEGRGIEMVLTLGTGAGTALFRDGELMPHLELSHHPITKDKNYDEYIGNAAKEKIGKKRWNKRVERVLEVLTVVVNFDKLWIGGGNSAHLKFDLPSNVEVVDNSKGIEGGARLWHAHSVRETRQLPHFNQREGSH